MLDNLPFEILYIIIELLSPDSICRLSKTCASIHSYVTSEIGDQEIDMSDIFSPTIFSEIKILKKQKINAKFNSFQLTNPKYIFKHNMYGMEVINSFSVDVDKFTNQKFGKLASELFNISINGSDVKLKSNAVHIKYHTQFEVYHDKNIKNDVNKVMNLRNEGSNKDCVGLIVIELNYGPNIFNGDYTPNYVAFFYSRNLKFKEFSVIPHNVYISYTMSF